MARLRDSLKARFSAVAVLSAKLVLGAACGFFWFLVLFLVFAARRYIAAKAAGTFYRDEFLFLMLSVAASTFWILPLFGAAAALKWPSTLVRRKLRAQQVPAGGKPIVILIHGTFAATETDEGSAWWQIGAILSSALEKRAPGEFAFFPFHWSGENLESARRRAARALSVILRQLEKEARPYHLVAHSHGGNIAWQALVRCTAQRQRLEHLRGWTTTGSPFFALKTKTPQAWHAISLILFAMLFLRGHYSVHRMWTKTNSMWSVFESFPGGMLMPIVLDTAIVTAAAIAGLVAFDLAIRLTGVVRNHIRRLQEIAAYESYGGLHHALSSSTDEAINGLSAALRLDSRSLRFVRAAPYFNRSFSGKLVSPLTFPFVALWNVIVPVPVNSWVFGLFKDKVYGNDLPRTEIAAVSSVPLSSSVGGSLTPEEEQNLRTQTIERAGATLTRARQALGIFAAGSPVSIALQHLGPNTLDALVHTSYFENTGIVESICGFILGDHAAIRRPETAMARRTRPEFRQALSNLALPHAFLMSVVFVAAWVVIIAVYLTGVVPRTTSSRLEGMASQNTTAANFSRGREARIWYAALCSSGRCEDAVPGYHFEIESIDNLESMLDLIRWQAACTGKTCELRDSLIGYTTHQLSAANPILYEESAHENFVQLIDRLWLAAGKLAGVTQVPDLFSDEAKPVTAKDRLKKLATLLQTFNARLQHPSSMPGDLRSRMQYITPLFTLQASLEQMKEWDKGASTAARLDNKLRLAAACACRNDLRPPLWYNEAEYPSESIDRVNRTSHLWWGECVEHARIAQLALSAAFADYRQLSLRGIARVSVLARYWAILSQVEADVQEHNDGDPWLAWAAKAEQDLRHEVEPFVLREAARPSWYSILPVLQELRTQRRTSFSEHDQAELECTILKQLKHHPESLREIITVCLAMKQRQNLTSEILRAAIAHPGIAATCADLFVPFLRLVGHDEIQSACRNSQGTPPCTLSDLGYAWGMEQAGRAAAEQTLRAAQKKEPYGFFGRESAKQDVESVFTAEAFLHTYLESGLVQRCGDEAASQMYFQAARGMAAVGKFQQALQYFDRINTYEDRLLAGADILLLYEQLRRAFRTEDLDFIADWGNRNWDDVRREWIRKNPSH